MAKKKIGLIGGGQIGGNLALIAVQKQLGDVVLYDIPQAEGMVKGKALDINQLTAVDGYDCRVTGTTDWKDVAGSDILIITAGVPRKPGMSREDLLDINLKIMRDVAGNIKAHCPDSFVINIANPLDAMVYALHQITGFKSSQVVRSEEHTSELQSLAYLVCRLLLEKKKKKHNQHLHFPTILLIKSIFFNE